MMNDKKLDSISLIICTYNRADSLSDTLKSLLTLELNDLRFELIVVDNNSTDATRKVVQNFSEKASFPVKYIHEMQQGLSYARNTGINNASGDYLFFTDDDVIPESDWIIVTLRQFKKFDCIACGGYIAPIWLGEKKPDWLTDTFYGFVAIKTDTEGPKQLTEQSELPFGANMAFKRSVFKRYGLFDVNRGRSGTNLASGEDGELFQRILQANEIVYYFPDSRVNHKVEVFRQKKNYFRRWRYQASKNIAFVKGVPGKRRISGVPYYMFIQLFRALLIAFAARFTMANDDAFFKELLVFHFLGAINGLYKKNK